MFGLGTAGVTRHSPCLAQGGELGVPAGEQLVNVGLVAGVPQDQVVGGVEAAVECQGQFDGAQVGAQVAAAGAGVHRIDDEGTDLLGQFCKLVTVQFANILRALDLLQQHAGHLHK